jgi:succinate dehydrogenase / fumarate reductase cytochrome b subunit
MALRSIFGSVQQYAQPTTMKWFLDLFSSSLGKKIVMALTGIFLILFLTVHLTGNLQLLKDDGGRAFNIYADFMGHNPFIQLVSKGNFAFIIIHIVWALVLTIQNRRARGTVGYAQPNKKSAWSSRNMGILGTIILVFLVMHIRHFYAEAHFGSLPTQVYDGKEVLNLYGQVVVWFQKDWYVALYVFSMIALSFHLWHGFASAFQTLGLNHMKYNPVINFVGKAYAIVVPAGFAIIPLWMFFA